MAANLHGQPVSIGDRVYDEQDGWGCVESVTCSCLWVKVGKRSMRKYTFDGWTGRRKKPTLFFHPQPRLILSKDPCKALEQRKLLEEYIDLLNRMCPDDPVTMVCECAQCSENPCGCC